MDLLQEYKEMYYKELELKDSLSGKIGTSITLLAILCTGHMFMWNIMINLDVVLRFFPIMFLFFDIIFTFYTALSMWYFYKTYYKYQFCYISPDEVSKEIKKNMDLSDMYTQREIKAANCKMLENTYLCYATANRKENLRKSKNQMKMNTAIVKALFVMGLTYITWIFIINRVVY